jgi:hypothetical protein
VSFFVDLPRLAPEPVTSICALIIDMAAIRARVENGRLIVDEPTDLPDGELIDLVPLDEVLARGGDYLDDEERERLHRSLRESIEQMKAGQTIDADEALAELEAHR